MAHLAHESGNNTVEAGSGVSEAFFSGAKGTEVFSGSGNNVGAKLHDDATSGLTSNGDIKVATGK